MADAISDVVKHGTILALGHLYKEERLLTSAAIRYWLGPVDIVSACVGSTEWHLHKHEMTIPEIF
jgi:hypothetical protein